MTRAANDVFIQDHHIDTLNRQLAAVYLEQLSPEFRILCPDYPVIVMQGAREVGLVAGGMIFNITPDFSQGLNVAIVMVWCTAFNTLTIADVLLEDPNINPKLILAEEVQVESMARGLVRQLLTRNDPAWGRPSYKLVRNALHPQIRSLYTRSTHDDVSTAHVITYDGTDYQIEGDDPYLVQLVKGENFDEYDEPTTGELATRYVLYAISAANNDTRLVGLSDGVSPLWSLCQRIYRDQLYRHERSQPTRLPEEYAAVIEMMQEGEELP